MKYSGFDEIVMLLELNELHLNIAKYSKSFVKAREIIEKTREKIYFKGRPHFLRASYRDIYFWKKNLEKSDYKSWKHRCLQQLQKIFNQILEDWFSRKLLIHTIPATLKHWDLVAGSSMSIRTEVTVNLSSTPNNLKSNHVS